MDALKGPTEQGDFHFPIISPAHFHGRKLILQDFLSTPWRVLILLGGRGMGKTSVLNQFDYHLNHDVPSGRMLPVTLNLNSEKPADTQDLLHLMLSRLEDAPAGAPLDPTPEKVTPSIFEERLIGSIGNLRRSGYYGVCFLLDECEQLVDQAWWKDDASGVLRSYLESRSLMTRVGFVLTGFRALRDHRQKVGSRLMLEADWKYLTPLELHDIKALVLARCGPGSVSQEEVADLYEEAGGHPWLTQRLLSRWIATKAESPRPSMCELALAFHEQHEVLFENWWGENGYSGGLTGLEREIYRAILLHPKLSVSDASNTTNQSENDCRKALKILLGLGAVMETERGLYRTGARIFAQWVRSKPPKHAEKRCPLSDFAISSPLPNAGANAFMSKIKVLFLSANPVATPKLQLDEEIRQIGIKLRAAEYRDAFDFIPRFAARPNDLLQALLEVKPQIVHFSGHGTQGKPISGPPTSPLPSGRDLIPQDSGQAGQLIFMGDRGQPHPVSHEALVHLFRTLRDNVRVVVLNACHSRPQAEALAETTDCSIGMNQPIGDEAAIVFAASFYQALGFGRSVREAFELGKAALLLEGIPEDKTPELFTRQGVDDTRLILIPPPAAAMSGAEESEAKGRVGVPARLALVRDLSGLAPTDWARLVTSIEGAAAHVSHNLPIPEQVAQLVRWAESTNGPKLAAVEEAFKELRNP